jgi:hypothetical protein
MAKHLKTISFTANKDSGSLNCGQFEGAEHGLRPSTLMLQVAGEPKPRAVTYIMGSPTKGYSVCCKGTGELPTSGEAELIDTAQDE